MTVAGAALLVLFGGCGGDGDAGARDAHAHSHDQEHMDGAEDDAGGFAFGAPGLASAATRTIEVAARDSYRFEPAGIEVEPGETVTFVVTNVGDEQHEFVLGDQEYQESHGGEMAARAMHHDEGNAVTLAPGATRELTWTFPDDGEVLYGCHVAGHYDAGMVGAIRVSA